MTGRIHSIQTLGAVDGPGLRGVVFMQGCPLRCAYCHNPDTWQGGIGEEIGADELIGRLERYKGYYKNGGITVSGGEPLWQGEFVGELFEKAHERGLHTALDTSGIGSSRAIQAALAHADLVLCDIKFADEAAYRAHSGGELSRVLDFLRLAEEKGIPLWVRHVVVPGLTDGEASIRAIGRLARRFSNLEKIELLPFKKLCTAKYQSMGIPFPLEGTPECTPEAIDRCYKWIENEADA